jgi:hypothetical protein
MAAGAMRHGDLLLGHPSVVEATGIDNREV